MAAEIKQFLAYGRGIGLSGCSAIAPCMPRLPGDHIKTTTGYHEIEQLQQPR